MIFQFEGPFASVSIAQEDLAMEKRHNLKAEDNKLLVIRKTWDKSLTGAWAATEQPHRLPHNSLSASGL